MTRRELEALNKTAEDFEPDTDAYYAQTAIDYHGSAVRNNTFGELVAIGKEIDWSLV